MAMFYTPIETNLMRERRQKSEPGISLVRCSDDLWRTEEEKAAFDEARTETATGEA